MGRQNQLLKKVPKHCNICGNPEAPRKIGEKDQTIYCFGHVGLHYSLWNLTPAYDAHGNKLPCFRDFQRYLARKKERLGQSTKGVDVNATAPEPDEPFIVAEEAQS